MILVQVWVLDCSIIICCPTCCCFASFFFVFAAESLAGASPILFRLHKTVMTAVLSETYRCINVFFHVFFTDGSCLRETFRISCSWERGKEAQFSVPTTWRLRDYKSSNQPIVHKRVRKYYHCYMCIHHASLLSSSTRRDFERCLFCFRCFCITRRVADSYFMHHSGFIRICTCWY